nr:MAG TPA_asm: hypothetical protein [Caudoviricetes sp.]
MQRMYRRLIRLLIMRLLILFMMQKTSLENITRDSL